MNHMHWAACFVAAVVFNGLLVGPSAIATAASPDRANKLWVYVGTYTKGTASQGIYRLELDLLRGELKSCSLAAEAVNPSFVAIHPNRRWLYAVGEVGGGPGKKNGEVNAFSIEPHSGRLRLLGQQPSGGAGPCHVLVDRSGRCVLVANYSSGSVACLPIDDDGRLGAATSIVRHIGSSVNPRRQEGPHAHATTLDAANRLAFVCDLGLDKIMIYRLDPARALLTPSDPSSVGVVPGVGPRHFAFHPNGRFAYVVDELASQVDVFAYESSHGRLAAIQSISTLPPDFRGNNTAAEIAVHPSGKFLYASNRGHDSIATFSIEERSGVLHPLGHAPAQGRTPRSFSIDPSGVFLLVANQDGGNVVLLRIGDDGKLTSTGSSLSVAAPVCVEMMPPRENE
jgi:6-phosphogluconolactonase